MARTNLEVEVNKLSGGILTEANPLDFPSGASLDEVNFVLNRNGTRDRRLGAEYEEGSTIDETSLNYDTDNPPVVSSYLWLNPGGVPKASILVIQVSNELYLYDTSAPTIVEGKIGSAITLDASTRENIYSFEEVEGILVVATGAPIIYYFTYIISELTGEIVISQSEERLTIRDLFGVDSPYLLNWEDQEESDYEANQVDLTDPEYVTIRPDDEGFPQEGVAEEFTSDSLDYSPGQIAFLGATPEGNGLDPDNLYGSEIDFISMVQFSNSSQYSQYFIGFSVAPASDSFTITDHLAGDLQTVVNRDWQSTGQKQYFSQHGETPGSVFSAWQANGSLSLSLVADEGSAPHLYNLRNQSWSPRRFEKTGVTPEDPVRSYRDIHDQKFPSNSDTVGAALYPNIGDADNKTADRFHAKDLKGNPPGTFQSPKGYFIIDALSRSDSREERWLGMNDEQNYTDFSKLPPDTTEGGATVVHEYAGRLWYGGFSNSTDESATRLESYILYSQFANNIKVLPRCYQIGDPTSVDNNDVLATDGGFLPLDGAFNIKEMATIGSWMVIFADNGVWGISGNDGNYFTPTSQRVSKVINKGAISRQSVVEVDGAVLYWADNGIYAISPNENGLLSAQSISEDTIQELYGSISSTDRATCVGSYETYNGEVVWTYYNTLGHTEKCESLILKLETGAFTRYVYEDGDVARTVFSHSALPPYSLQASLEVVTVEGEEVESGIEAVVNPTFEAVDRPQTNKLTILSEEVSGNIGIGFAELSNTEFLDWGESDASAYILTGYFTGGDTQRNKQVPYIVFHFERTEGDLVDDPEDGYVPSNRSSCIVQAQWEWTDSVNSGRWGKEFQAYRLKRHYIPDNLEDPYEPGFSTVVTRNKLRGRGRALSMLLKTEESRDCKILGWGNTMAMSNSQ